MVPASIERAINERRDWLKVIDHHGYFNDGREVAAFPRVVAALSELRAAGYLESNATVITNQGNLDPDGLLSFFAVRHPEVALQHQPLLSAVAHFTDFSMFGGERVDDAYRPKDLPLAKLVGFAILRQITKQQELLVEGVLAKSINDATPSEVRGVFIAPTAGETPRYDAAAVKSIYDAIVDSYLPRLLMVIKESGSLDGEFLYDAVEAIERVRYVAARAREVTTVHGVDAEYPKGKLVSLSPDSGFTERLDKPYKVHDWLLEAVGQFVHDAPVYVRTYRGLTVVSVRYPRPAEDRPVDFNMNVVTDLIQPHQPDSPFYGRKEVSLGRLAPGGLSHLELVQLILKHWNDGERPIATAKDS
jgi:hypothetical protein